MSAVAKGMAASIIIAQNAQVLDPTYSMSFGKLFEFLTGNDLSKIKRAVLFGSRPPPNDSIWRHAERAGFEVRLEDRNFQGKEKKIDTGIVTLMMKDAYKHGSANDDLFVIVAGDKDYVPGPERTHLGQLQGRSRLLEARCPRAQGTRQPNSSRCTSI